MLVDWAGAVNGFLAPSGIAASVGLVALKLLGYGDAANFAGSWYEWEADPSNPVQVDQ